jgi:hypothetical protein
MIHKGNIHHVTQVRRPVSAITVGSGFGASLKTHPHQFGRSYFDTTHGAFFGKVPAQEEPLSFVQKFQDSYYKEAGGNKRAYEDQRVRLVSNLTGEVYSNFHDPQEKTDV